MSEYWPLVLIITLPSLLLGAGIYSRTSVGEAPFLRLIRPWAIGCLTIIPTAIVILGIAFMHDMRLKPGTGSTANHIATNVVVLLSGMELLVIIFLAAVLGFVSDELSPDRRGGGVMIALGFIPVTFFALIIAGQMLAGVSL